MIKLLVGMIVCASVCGLVSEVCRGRAGAGFVAGLLLGPLGFLVILIMDDHRKKDRPRKRSSEPDFKQPPPYELPAQPLDDVLDWIGPPPPKPPAK